jgi:uncharacterized membrane protein HdeD (DUF308 family)
MKYWYLWLLAGVLSIVGGIVALANPFAASLTASVLAGWMFMAIGVLTILSAFGDKGWGGRFLAVLVGVLILLLGFSLVANPLRAVLQLTVVAAILLGMTGVFRILLAFAPEARLARWPLIISGALSLLLAAMIITNFPYSAAVTLGIFLAVELISNGVTLIVIALDRKEPEAA